MTIAVKQNTNTSVCSQPYDGKGSGSQTVSPNEGGGAEPILRNRAPFSQKKLKASRVRAISKFAAWCYLESYSIVSEEELDDIFDNKDETYIKELLLHGLHSKGLLIRD
ncbi:hypothetical protein [Bacillus cihuensis]|uniref:hypothetical protein n=1 Tax=Bacillus cihuensis TaxID=1208599 RepID=UPI00041F2B3B|nr:hypothetical protein [Bacillus cihuensis]